MANEGPYGGRIVVQQDDKSNPIVSWQASARVFPGFEDNLGALEYAVRMVDANNTLAASRDRKCLVLVKARPVSPTVDTRVLIVSGYDLPHGEDSRPNSPRLLGQAYFITAGAHDPDGSLGPSTGPYAQFPISYDATLFFDDYDLNRLRLVEDPSPSNLGLCYVQWERVTYLTPVDKQVAPTPLGEEEIKILRSELRDLDEKLQQAIDDNTFTEAAAHYEAIQRKEASSGRRLVSVWRQVWRQVILVSDPAMQHRQRATNIDGTLTEPIVVAADAIIKTAGSRSVAVKGLSQPAHLGIMYHADPQPA